MRLLTQLIDKLSTRADVQSHVTQDRLQHLDVALEQLRQDAPMLMEWLEVEMNKLEFLINKYRGEDGVGDYNNRLVQLEKIKTHLSYFLSIK